MDFSSFKMKQYDSIEIFCDGAITGINKKMKHCGVGIIPSNKEFEYIYLSFRGENWTNNKLEIIAVIISILLAVETHEGKDNKLNINIKTDSRLVVDGFNNFLDKWENNNWATNSGGLVKNKRYWEVLSRIKSNLSRQKFFINVQWVKGHEEVGNNNDLADRYANIGKNKALEEDSGLNEDDTFAVINKFLFINKL